MEIVRDVGLLTDVGFYILLENNSIFPILAVL